MVTGKTPEHQALDRAAIRSFNEQTHTDRELVIVNDGVYRLFPEGCPANVVEIDARKEEGRYSLGELRNMGLEVARGDYIAQWDSDDYSHPMRLATMLQYIKPNMAVVLKAQIRYSTVHNVAKVYTAKRGIAGTVLHAKTARRYEAVGKHEDSWFLDTFGSNRLILDNSNSNNRGPDLYIRLYHGNNTWSAKHIMGKDIRTVNRWQLTAVQKSYLSGVLRHAYGLRPKVC